MERAEGLEAVFSCQYQEEGFFVTYDWAINNTILGADTETVRARQPSSPDGPATLTILATPQHSNSDVQCVARVLDGIDIVRSELSITATLTVHGELVTIMMCIRFCRYFPIGTVITNVLTAPNTITVTWNALPFTEYSVDTTKTTLDYTEIVVLDSVCGLANEYIFMYSDPTSVCDRFSFTVTPTDGEMRGTTSEPDTGFFTRAEGVYGALYTLLVTLLHYAGSIEERHRIRESEENKSVGFKATVSYFIVSEIYTCTHAY